MATPELRRCPICKTRTLIRDGQHLVCTECKKRFAAPEPKPKWREDLWEKHQYYERNKAAILSDIQTLGRIETRKKWALPGSTLGTLLKRWGDPGSLPQSHAEVKSEEQIPVLPAFSNNWDAEVQIKWLDVYGELYANRQ